MAGGRGGGAARQGWAPTAAHDMAMVGSFAFLTGREGKRCIRQVGPWATSANYPHRYATSARQVGPTCQFHCFVGKSNNRFSALCIRHIPGGFLSPGLNVIPSCYPSPKCGNFG